MYISPRILGDEEKEGLHYMTKWRRQPVVSRDSSENYPSKRFVSVPITTKLVGMRLQKSRTT